jgi:hypothetical protein
MSRIRVGLVLAALAIVLPLSAGAQCTNLGGNPLPTPEIYGANAVNLRYLGTGPGSNDDKPQLKKSLSMNAGFVGFDPALTHSVTVTIRRGSNVGPVMWSGTIPAGSGFWTSIPLPGGAIRWTYNDPTVSFGVRRARIVSYAGGVYIVDKFFGQLANIANAPVSAGVDPVHVQVEFYDGTNTGTCYDGVTQPCTGLGNTQKCRV